MTAHRQALFWFRRDLRADDNAALYHALVSAERVHCIFVFDTEILDNLPARARAAATDTPDRRVEFIWHSVNELRAALEKLGGALTIAHGKAAELIPNYARQLAVDAVFANHDYEPLAIVRDDAVRAALKQDGIAFYSYKDQVIFEKDEVLTQNARPFSVFTPYKNAWLKKLDPFYLKGYPVEEYRARFVPATKSAPPPSLAAMGFATTNLLDLKLKPGASGAHQLFDDFRARVDHYDAARNFPSVKGVSYLSVHQRFGTISIRELARFARAQPSRGAQVWLSELVWRDFYFQILWHFPHVAERAFRRRFEALAFENREDYFLAWCEARTGYPIVDAAMRQINQTGYMHNRLRMIVASFLVKDLLIDWRWGEAYFAEHLNDFDLAANNGGWQWAASTGCDAQPYFRVFNPVTQSEKFDPQGKFIRRYVPELAGCADRQIHAPWLMDAAEQRQAAVLVGADYPAPIVEHAEQRLKALVLYGKINK